MTSIHMIFQKEIRNKMDDTNIIIYLNIIFWTKFTVNYVKFRNSGMNKITMYIKRTLSKAYYDVEEFLRDKIDS